MTERKKKKWTLEEFKRECAKIMQSQDPLLLEKQARRRAWLKKYMNKSGIKHSAKS